MMIRDVLLMCGDKFLGKYDKQSRISSNMRYAVTGALLALGLSVCANVTHAGEADVVDVNIKHQGNNQYRISTAVKHGDTGWSHYADGWEVLDVDGNIIGKRVLHHPHENEQPFTRSLSLEIPEKYKEVTIRAHDSVHGYGGKTITVAVPRSQ